MADVNAPSQPVLPSGSSPALPPSPAGPAGSSRPGLFWPVVLVGAGVVALLFNLGYLNWSVVSRITAFWPLLLILLGAQLLLQGRLSRRLAAATGAVLVVLVLLAIMAGIASIPGANGGATPSRTTSYSGSIGSLSRARLDLSLGATQLAVDSADLGADLYRASITLPRGETPTVTAADNGTLSIAAPNRSGLSWPFLDVQRRLQLPLSNHLPWRIDANTGASN